jgi:hypothetical protein
MQESKVPKLTSISDVDEDISENGYGDSSSSSQIPDVVDKVMNLPVP